MVENNSTIKATVEITNIKELENLIEQLNKDIEK